MLVLLLVALWFILPGDLLCVFPCVILFLCFSVLLVLRLPRLGKRELILVLFVRLFGLCLFRFVGFLFLFGIWEGLRFVIVALPGLFSYLFFMMHVPMAVTLEIDFCGCCCSYFFLFFLQFFSFLFFFFFLFYFFTIFTNFCKAINSYTYK